MLCSGCALGFLPQFPYLSQAWGSRLLLQAPVYVKEAAVVMVGSDFTRSQRVR